jgi:hypothetical protein
MASARLRNWSDIEITAKGEAIHSKRGLDLMGDVPQYTREVAKDGRISAAWFFFVGALAIIAAVVHWAGSNSAWVNFAMPLGLAVLVLVPFTIGPIIENVLTAIPRGARKWLLIAMGLAVVGYAFIHDAQEKAHGAEGGIASVYSTREQGSRTASGRPLNDGALTAAHKSLPFGTKVKVTNTRNGKSVVVTITDRGPFVRGRVIDLTVAAAGQLGFNGLAHVSLEVLGRG